MKNIIKYNYIGIRGTDEPLQVGEMLTTSYLWNHELDMSTYDTDEPVELGGVCAVDTMINGSTVEHIDWRYAGGIGNMLNKAKIKKSRTNPTLQAQTEVIRPYFLLSLSANPESVNFCLRILLPG